MKRKSKACPTPGDIIATVGLTRRNNLRALVGPGKRFTSQLELASVLNVTEGYLSQLIGATPIRRVTETTARKFEYKLGLRAGVLDLSIAE